MSIDGHAAPMIQKINNHTNIGFVILEHSDTSSCSLQGRGKIIEARSSFSDAFLLEPGKPSLVLRPIYYFDIETNKPIFFADVNDQEIPEKLQDAYTVWKNEKISKRIKSPKAWLHDWIGLDLIVTPHDVEILGYLINWSRVEVKNNKKTHTAWLSFSKGIFSKLVLELDIKQHKTRGISATLKVLHGQGGFCSADGKVYAS